MPYIIGVIVIVLIAVGFALLRSNSAEDSTVVTKTEQTLPEEINPAAAGTSEAMQAVLPDGVYTTSVTYLTPAKDEYLLDVSLTITNSVISDANIVYSQGAENDPNAQRFEGAYKLEVIGKSIDALDLSRVGGASLTTGAFNEAVGKILTENT